MGTWGGGDPDNSPLRVWVAKILKSHLLREAFIIRSARISSAVSLQLPSLRIFNLLTRCICCMSKWRVLPMKSFQEISSFSKSGREGSKATRSEHKKKQICVCNLWFVVNRIHCLLLCKRIEGGWTCWLSTKQGSLSRTTGDTVTFTLPVSWDVFYFRQITALWKCSGVSIRFHKYSFIVVEIVILLLGLLLPLSLYCVYWSFYFAKPPDTRHPVVLLDPQAEGLGNTPLAGPLRLRVPVTFSFLSWSPGSHHLTKFLLYLHGPTCAGLDWHKPWPEPSLSLLHCSRKLKLLSVNKILRGHIYLLQQQDLRVEMPKSRGESVFACLLLNIYLEC